MLRGFATAWEHTFGICSGWMATGQKNINYIFHSEMFLHAMRKKVFSALGESPISCCCYCYLLLPLVLPSSHAGFCCSVLLLLSLSPPSSSVLLLLFRRSSSETGGRGGTAAFVARKEKKIKNCRPHEGEGREGGEERGSAYYAPFPLVVIVPGRRKGEEKDFPPALESSVPSEIEGVEKVRIGSDIFVSLCLCSLHFFEINLEIPLGFVLTMFFF